MKTITCPTCATKLAVQPLETLAIEYEDEMLVAAGPVTYEWVDKFLLPLPDDFTGKVMVLRPDALGERWQRAKFQLLRVTGGFGAQAGKIGTKVYGTHLADGEDTECRRSDFIGEATPYLIELAARDKAPEAPLDLTRMGYFALGTSGTWGRAATPQGAKDQVRKAGGKPRVVYHCHIETRLTDLYYMQWPKGAPEPVEVWRSKKT